MRLKPTALPLAPALAWALGLALSAVTAAAEPWPDGAPNRPDITPAFPDQTEARAVLTTPAPVLDTLTARLDAPWAIDVLPGDAGYLVTERGGTLRHVARDGTVSAPIAGVPEVLAERQGGLLDLALAPDFAKAAPSISPSPPRSGRPIRHRRDPRDPCARSDPAGRGDRDLSPDAPRAPPAISAAASCRCPTGRSRSPRATGCAMRPAHRTRAHPMAVSSASGPTERPRPTIPLPVAAMPCRPSSATAIATCKGAAVDATGRLWTLEHGPAGGDELNLIRPARITAGLSPATG
jgi:aldose sugar dehydrogenase